MNARHLGFWRAVIFGMAVPAALACINTLRSDLYHHKANSDAEGVAKVVAQLEQEYREKPTLETVNDLAVGRVFAGRYDDAIALLREAESKYPGHAVVAANMGTAFELAGNDEAALHWISEGVRRDPREHSGSEWLHVRILEAKIALAKDPEWLRSHTVLGVSFGTEPVPILNGELPKNEQGVTRAIVDVVRSIDYQLGERTTFVKAPDAVISDLYAAAGDLIWAAGKAEVWEDHIGYPDHYYEAATAYAADPDSGLMKTRRAKFQALYPPPKWNPPDKVQVAIPTPENTVNPTRGQRWLILSLLLLLAAGAGVAAYFLRLRSLRKP